MTSWLTETEFRQSGAQATGLTINVAFLKEIKQDNVEFRQLLDQVFWQLKDRKKLRAREVADVLSDLRDELETYFALEEFYGYFQQAAVKNPSVSHRADDLRSDHERLFLQLNEIVDLAEQIVYRESPPDTTLNQVIDGFEQFFMSLRQHEQSEMDLMMRLCNEDIGVGD